ncbi:MAG: 3-hydroxybutyryl-CoA dehydrogenase [Chloroflexi bacterium]|nr:3-hydroxybutyryl-CoA dehydrogenase [Chloroflexota bacterium]
MNIKTVGVVGCGLMGSGIVEVCARRGYNVIVREVNDDFLSQGLARLRESIQRAVDRGKLSAADRDAASARVRGTTEMRDLAACDLVIEAAIENLELKKDIFKQLAAVTRPDAILASNTSSLAVMEMAAMTNKPDKVIGMHFFNPVPVMPLLEMVRTFLTSEETYQTARAFGEGLGKTIIVSKDAPGFIVNALLIQYLLDAVRMYENNFATKEDILFIADEMFRELKDARFAAPALLRRMVAAGYAGKKSGKGFYEYGK